MALAVRRRGRRRRGERRSNKGVAKVDRIFAREALGLEPRLDNVERRDHKGGDCASNRGGKGAKEEKVRVVACGEQVLCAKRSLTL